MESWLLLSDISAVALPPLFCLWAAAAAAAAAAGLSFVRGEGMMNGWRRGRGLPPSGGRLSLTLSLSPFGEGEDLRMRKCGD